MVLIRFSFFSRGDNDRDRVSAIPIVSHVDWWAFATLLYQDTQPSGGFGQARRLLAQESKSISWLTNGILLASQEKSNLLDSHKNEAQDKRIWERRMRQKDV
jgi:hypothetical protein